MAAYVEVRTKGGGRAILEAGSIAGGMMAPGANAMSLGDDKSPVLIVIRGGETIEMVGESIGKLLVRCALIRQRLKDEGHEILVDFLDKAGGEDDDETAKP